MKTDFDNVCREEVYKTFSDLRSSIDAFSCAADLIPEGFEGENMGHLFRVLSSRIEVDLIAHSCSLRFSVC